MAFRLKLVGFVDDDFSGFVQAMPLLAGDHPRFNFVSASPTVMQFIAGATQPVELAPGNGGGWLAYYIAPSVPHISLEAKIYLTNSAMPATAKMGVFGRLSDVNNFVGAVINCNTGRLEVFHRVGGTYNVLANPATVISAASLYKGVSLKIELIGRRLRYWFNPRFFRVDDAPPDGAVDLLLDPNEDDPGEWGIFAQSDSSGTNFRAAHFYAREIPNKALPAPDVTFTNATGLSLSPITATVASLAADTIQLEWQIGPADVDDFVEVYSDKTPSSLTSRVFWVRPGYSYDVRVREVSDLGIVGDWISATRLVISGSKTAPTAAVFPDDDFPDVTPDYVMESGASSSAEAMISGTSRERLSTSQARPRRKWNLTFENRTQDDVNAIRTFFEFAQGRVKPFKWLHPTGEQFAVRFDVDELEITTIDEGAVSAIYRVGFSLVEVMVGVVETLAPTIECAI